jgi:hypothetical protein
LQTSNSGNGNRGKLSLHKVALNSMVSFLGKFFFFLSALWYSSVGYSQTVCFHEEIDGKVALGGVLVNTFNLQNDSIFYFNLEYGELQSSGFGRYAKLKDGNFKFFPISLNKKTNSYCLLDRSEKLTGKLKIVLSNSCVCFNLNDFKISDIHQNEIMLDSEITLKRDSNYYALVLKNEIVLEIKGSDRDCSGFYFVSAFCGYDSLDIFKNGYLLSSSNGKRIRIKVGDHFVYFVR